jgi:MFS family permease
MMTHPQRRTPTADGRSKFSVLLTASLVSSLIMLDANIVAVSLPSIARSLGATFTEIEWVVSAYVLPFAALLLAAGSYADRHGRKRATLLGLVVFTVASALCGLATSAFMLNLARALQGVGASLLLSACALTGMPYAVFIIGMLVAGAGAGLLNSETATVMQSAVPAQRARMASGLSATTRFTGLLLGVAALGAVLSDSVARRFVTASTALGVDPEMAAAAAKRVAAGALKGRLQACPQRCRPTSMPLLLRHSPAALPRQASWPPPSLP